VVVKFFIVVHIGKIPGNGFYQVTVAGGKGQQNKYGQQQEQRKQDLAKGFHGMQWLEQAEILGCANG
jgi:hypothetical protein